VQRIAHQERGAGEVEGMGEVEGEVEREEGEGGASVASSIQWRRMRRKNRRMRRKMGVIVGKKNIDHITFSCYI
jgi:hypothetical protein